MAAPMSAAPLVSDPVVSAQDLITGLPLDGRGGWREWTSPITPRQQWNANFGYCGETSLISAGLAYGQYTSQWTARALASPGVPQWRESSQLLLGENDGAAARRMKLQAEPFDTQQQRTTPEFLAWCKQWVQRGAVVILGVFNNVRRLGEPLAGDSVYDHIVPVVAVGSGSDRPYAPDDTITISDNGLYTEGAEVPFLFTESFAAFQGNRRQANAPRGSLYTLRDTPPNYGLAVSGVRDPSGVTVPVRLSASLDGEGLQNQAELRQPPEPLPLSLTARVTIPDPSQAYVLYRYDDFASVPVSGFNAAADQAVQRWLIPPFSGLSAEVSVTGWSDQTVVFRAVPATAA
ncbi:hypothetical protein [Synechococcus sp. CS-1328]|uniref:hypothetical protein n=1 Tax=Synechococcus sp. CS-1328 TaxID=2847976 RepID=UPI00223AEAFA|nr:hypothetical protein [Synechococcus sp. CS-1328]MCT0223728.1 hypothetical protein [Synechococcus sp. CS-1328]